MKLFLPLLAVAAMLVPLHAAQNFVTHPTAPGTYTNGEWTYVYLIRSPGSRSEGRIGHLFFQGREIKGEWGNVVETPVGKFIYFRDPDKIFLFGEVGWLMTLTYDKPVWNKWGGFDAQFVKDNAAYLKQVKYLPLDDLPLPRWAMPPFRYAPAIAWADATVKTDVPKPERIYLFGPGSVTETSLVNGVKITGTTFGRQIFSFKTATKLRDIFNQAWELKGDWVVEVYRGGNYPTPVWAAPFEDASRSGFPLQAGDAIWMHHPLRYMVSYGPAQ